MNQTNSMYWERLVQDPSPAYARLFSQEETYMRKMIGKNDEVLDIGCGSGRNILSVIDITKNITGLDIDEKAIQETKRNLAAYPNVRVMQGDIVALPFEDRFFDVVVLSMTLVNLGDAKKSALSEMRRVTKDKGKIIVSVYSEKALPERLKMYRKLDAPIQEIKEKEGTVVFDPSIGAHTSEQFSRHALEKLVKSVGLEIIDCQEVENIAYLMILQRKK